MLLINELIVAALHEPPSLAEPATYAQAMSGPNAAKWRVAWQEELTQLANMGSWEEATPPPGAKMLTAKPVFQIKTQDGKVTRFKAHCTIRGCAQRPGIHYDDTFQPVSRASSLRLLLTIAATHDLEVLSADFDAAYLNAPIDKEELYVRFPPGYQPSDLTATCLRLLKSVYGLKQAGHLWWKLVEDALVEYGCQRVQSEWGLYTLCTDNKTTLLVLLYVNDIVATCIRSKSGKSQATDLFEFLGSRFSITILGPITHILGVTVTRNPANRSVAISQTAFIDTITDGLPGLSPVIAKHAPLPTPLPRSPDEPPASPAAACAYGTLIGKLLWLAFMTRPDVSFAVSYLARYTHAPTDYHIALAVRVVAYLANTRAMTLQLGGAPAPLTVYTDSDWCADRDQRRSTSSLAAFLNGSLINWSSRRQRLVAHSTMEAEYIAAADASHEILWMRTLLNEIGLPMTQPTQLHIDNQAAIRLAANPTLHERSKHIELRHHIIRQLVDLGIITLHYVPTGQQRADGFTKPLSGPNTANFRNDIRLTLPSTNM
ncbi:hypothetical protein CcaverHIS002_0301550 [Cutaneotrichosporon cavernicola]|uniref:Reverse transcriptase Ty1/copia-type domain-containing protein n=1 Tax=Cutaneotrichosporon cavernicola TaxID=279322 RepID=A0AA48L1R5_9TREE|nr:uncharacterized protein CcaverHIS019_0301500 [Cutaneotrichosporon cavernicola]BEI82287.1 hypothetical protein CcaverHIS002_0301550 [Cutaneotrichosporon cavernicola]BEI90080.1 hypothetical protein CcaverHIS019_0301500 [Cutaneotrichosporon cavernicola]BEI97857.1 hypothetical protein CcaverHIS631_0301560 [Cutaneotrichosporon cavernicola]BEJ05635.1 hypothetical protein CcaverHIS641_0301570 [Cutaneotrichosporon cavernicola]